MLKCLRKAKAKGRQNINRVKLWLLHHDSKCSEGMSKKFAVSHNLSYPVCVTCFYNRQGQTTYFSNLTLTCSFFTSNSQQQSKKEFSPNMLNQSLKLLGA